MHMIWKLAVKDVLCSRALKLNALLMLLVVVVSCATVSTPVFVIDPWKGPPLLTSPPSWNHVEGATTAEAREGVKTLQLIALASELSLGR
jgi:hypothetical protein